MALSEEQIKKIEKEEVSNNLNKVLSKKPAGKAWVILLAPPILVILFVLLPNFFGNSSNTQKKVDSNPVSNSKNPSSQANSQANEELKKKEEEQRKQQLQELSTLFCSERSKPNIRYVNLENFITMYEANGKTVTLNPAGGVYPTAENCEKIIDICLKQWNTEDCKNIAERKIWIGMTKDQLILSWGLPNDKNNSTYSFGVNSQWVYGNSQYVYLEGKATNDMKVTSWQD